MQAAATFRPVKEYGAAALRACGRSSESSGGVGNFTGKPQGKLMRGVAIGRNKADRTEERAA